MSNVILFSFIQSCPESSLSSDESIISERKDAGTNTSQGTATEPDFLGPCEPGTSVLLEGVVWQETQGGRLHLVDE